MSEARLTILDPIGEVDFEPMPIRPRPGDLTGKVIGFLDNTKPNFELLTEELERLLRDRYQIGGIVRVRKDNASVPARPEHLAELISRCDVVVAGSGD